MAAVAGHSTSLLLTLDDDDPCNASRAEFGGGSKPGGPPADNEDVDWRAANHG